MAVCFCYVDVDDGKLDVEDAQYLYKRLKKFLVAENERILFEKRNNQYKIHIPIHKYNRVTMKVDSFGFVGLIMRVLENDR